MTIQWRRVWMGVAGLAIIGSIFGLEWVFVNQRLAHHKPTRELGPYQATTTLTFEWPKIYPSTVDENATIRTSAMDLNTFVMILRSQRLAREVLSSYTPADMAILITPDYSKTGLISLGKVSIAASRSPASISITVLHLRSEASEMIATRYGRTFLDYLNSQEDRDYQFAIELLKARQREFIAELDATKAALSAAKDSNDLKQITALERTSGIQDLHVKNITNRLKESESHNRRSSIRINQGETRVEKVYRPWILSRILK
jgi:hypothetical protein